MLELAGGHYATNTSAAAAQPLSTRREMPPKYQNCNC